jgi:hypothetical protein
MYPTLEMYLFHYLIAVPNFSLYDRAVWELLVNRNSPVSACLDKADCVIGKVDGYTRFVSREKSSIYFIVLYSVWNNVHWHILYRISMIWKVSWKLFTHFGSWQQALAPDLKIQLGLDFTFYLKVTLCYKNGSCHGAQIHQSAVSALSALLITLLIVIIY